MHRQSAPVVRLARPSRPPSWPLRSVRGSPRRAPAPAEPALIPKPVSQERSPGRPSRCSPGDRLAASGRCRQGAGGAHRVADQLAAQLRRSTGLPAARTSGGAGRRSGSRPTARARSVPRATSCGPTTRLSPSRRRRRRACSAASPPCGSCCRPRRTRRTCSPGPGRSPVPTISDAPRYAYRGTMLDVSRHFFSRGRGQALHRPRVALQAEQAAPAPGRRPGLADPGRQLAAAHDVRRQPRGRRYAGRPLHEGASSRRSSSTPRSAISP